jgi:O-methyltransferase involved in polyketide biosynthesis
LTAVTSSAPLRDKDPQARYQSVDGFSKVPCKLDGVSETMLWTLYDRACEARRPDGILVDPDSVRIFNAIDYDFMRRFGEPVGTFAARAAQIDQLLQRWLERHPDGLIVSLGEGLETQAHRVDNGQMRWLTVDLPAAIELREHFLPSSERLRHLAASVFEAGWTEEVEPGDNVFIVVQGLFMYLEPDAVRRLFIRIVEHFPGAEIAFDVIPRWFSQLTQWGLMQTPHYRLPPMPWGINSDEIAARLHSWSPALATSSVLEYRAPHGWSKLTEDLFRMNPMTKGHLPCLVHAKVRNH